MPIGLMKTPHLGDGKSLAQDNMSKLTGGEPDSQRPWFPTASAASPRRWDEGMNPRYDQLVIARVRERVSERVTVTDRTTERMKARMTKRPDAGG